MPALPRVIADQRPDATGAQRYEPTRTPLAAGPALRTTWTLELVAVLTNPHDARAVDVWVDDVHVGFVQRTVLEGGSVGTPPRLLTSDRPVTVWAQLQQVGRPDGNYLWVRLLHQLDDGVAATWPAPGAFPPLDLRQGRRRPRRPGRVAGDAAHLRADPPVEPDRPQLSLPATPARLAQPSGGGLLQVSAEGTPVGRLSALESARRVGVLEQVLAAGREPYALLRLRSDAASSRLTASLMCLTDA